MMKNGFKVIPGNERYAINAGGVVFDAETQQYTLPAKDEKGDTFVRLERHGRRHKRLVVRLIEKAFGSDDGEGVGPGDDE